MLSRKTRVGLRAAICSAALLALPAVASPALASDAYLEPWVLKYDAAEGEANQTTISGANGPLVDNSPRLVTIDDPGAAITAHWGFLHGGGCETLKGSRVSCTLEDSFVEVSLGNLGDDFSMDTSAADVRASVWGDSGNDTLRGGRASDSLFGGEGTDTLRGRSGADFLIGGAGPDVADYSERTAPVTVTIPEPSPPYTGPIAVAIEGGIGGPRPEWPVPAGNDGESGEGDDVQADVEDVRGGSAADSLVGSSAANGLYGDAGDDFLDGGVGNDDLRGEGGYDRLRGSAGNDLLYGGPGWDHLDAGGGDDVIYAQDGARDTIDCGSGNDVVHADPADRLRDC